jgi:hypothetical protein
MRKKMKDMRKVAERGVRITKRSGRSNNLRYEKQMRELKATFEEGEVTENGM